MCNQRRKCVIIEAQYPKSNQLNQESKMIINKNRPAETAEVVQIDPIQQAFNAGVEDSSDIEAIKFAMVNAGAKFSNVNKLYKRMSIEAGLDLSKADRDSKVASLLEGQSFVTQEGFESSVKMVIADVPGMTPQRAALAVRSYAKKNELDIYKAPKGEGSRSSFVANFHNYMVDNTPFPSEEQARAYIEEHGTVNAKKRVAKLMLEWSMANRIVQKYS